VHLVVQHNLEIWHTKKQQRRLSVSTNIITFFFSKHTILRENLTTLR